MYSWHEMIWVWSLSTHKVIGVFCWYDAERFLYFPLYFVLLLLLLCGKHIWLMLLLLLCVYG